MSEFFRTLITRNYRFNAIFILFTFDGFLASAIWFIFFRPENPPEELTKNLIIAMIIFVMLTLFALLQTLNKMKRLRMYDLELKAEALRKKQIADREKLKNI